MTIAAAPLDPKQLIFSGTASHKGRRVSLSPDNSGLRHLHYGRILLDPEVSRVAFATGQRETALLSMRGACRVVVNGAAHDIGLHDAIYIPRGSSVEVSVDGSGEVDLVECAAEVEGDYPLQIIRYADVVKNPSLKFRAGGAATSRD